MNTECQVLIEITKNLEDISRENNDLCTSNLGNLHKTCQIISEFHKEMKLLRIQVERTCISVKPK